MWEEFYNAGIMAIGWGEIGNLKAFESKDAMKVKMKEVIDPDLSYKNAAHATWQFANEMKIGDVVFVKKGMHQLVGRGVVASDYEYDEERADEYANYRKVNWTHKGEWTHPGQAAMKTLTDITAYTEYVEKLNALFENYSENDAEETTKNYPVYTAEDFLDEVFMPEDEYLRLVGILKTKKNIILQGAPGVGKTFVAKRLAYSVMGVKDIERVMMVQFHQSYSYEDFIMGFRPSTDGFELKKGAFYNFCKKAEIDSDNDYFFIIDEINRGNLSKIFGELFMLIENDKRGISLQLLYSDEKFAVPKNVYIIGMMNTADRSLAMLDYALRRRFAFFEIKPGFETDGFREYRMAIDDARFNKLINCVENLNNEISADESLGEGFCIGHSYFCNLSADSIDEQTLYGIVEYELIPLLKEYWFDEPLKVKDWSNNLRSAIK
jgi:5-methylcytosine-specific restriction protein B